MSTSAIHFPPAALRLPEAANYLAVSPATLKKMVRENKIRSIKIERARVFPVDALNDLLSGRAPSAQA